ncbi:helix-turn-helix domain-containing protein [Planosporangium thailandense]|uniref:Helix-turn-helix domain-containing protein n=1 Tax=Planosporangium thailandense TaxID=765197 RepID=A0ABX0Y567_9ACTN|nr:IclR family transcriptional regulator C-terminal domain-containing protein [Planosporangium thailandense]NJC73561.1 helix-turn-helix domain-containing protein [Planosporangium thailandense]
MKNKEVYERPQYALASVDHALRLIQILRDTGEARLSDIARELGTSASTAHRLLAMLVYRGFAVQNESRAYSPGPALGVGPSNAPWTRQLKNLLLPHLELLSGRIDETVSLMFRVGGRVRFLASVEGSHVVRVGERTGTVLDARRASGGRAMLAELDRSELERLYRSPSARLAGDFMEEREFSQLVSSLERIRQIGYALNREETERGVWAVGTAIHDSASNLIASFAVSVPAVRSQFLVAPRTIALIGAAREEMEARLRAAAFVVS